MIDPAAVGSPRALYMSFNSKCAPSKGKSGVGRLPRREGTRINYKAISLSASVKTANFVRELVCWNFLSSSPFD